LDRGLGAGRGRGIENPHEIGFGWNLIQVASYNFGTWPGNLSELGGADNIARGKVRRGE